MIKAIPHATCGTQCHQSKTDADVKRENTKMWELYQILGREKKENLALSAFILEGNIG